MHCQRARTAMLDRELGLLSREAAAALDRHLACCERCSAAAAREQRLTMALASVRRVEPPRIDVTSRVVSRIDSLAPGPREEVPSRQLGWAAAAAVASALGLVLALWPLRPEFERLFVQTTTVLDSLGRLAAQSLNLAAMLLPIPIKLCVRLLESLAPLASLAGRLEPVASTGIALGIAVMVGTILFFVGRDVRGPRWVREE